MPHQLEKDEQVSPVVEMMREEARNFWRRVIDPNSVDEMICRYMVDFHLYLNNRDGFEIQRSAGKDMYDVAFEKADELFKKDIELKLPLKRFELANYIAWGMNWLEETKRTSRTRVTSPVIKKEESGVTDQPESEPAGLQRDEDILDEAERKRKARKERRDRRKREAQEQES